MFHIERFGGKDSEKRYCELLVLDFKYPGNVFKIEMSCLSNALDNALANALANDLSRI